MGLREEKKRATQQKIMQTARQLYLSQGFEQTSIEDVTAAAGISRMTFFNYFKSKERVLEALALEWFMSHRELFEGIEGFSAQELERAAVPPRLNQRLKIVAEHRSFLKLVVLHTRLFSGLDTGLMAEYSEIGELLKSHREARLGRVKEAQRAGFIDAELDSAAICQLYDALRNDVIGRWLVEDGGNAKSLKQNFQASLAIFLRGLRPDG
tara:strand:+ start:202 stop:831 length:630 start_codon:yes stop_codon:yes gene_type:complete